MPPRSPLPQRHGLDAAWLRTPDNVANTASRWATMADFLLHRLPAEAPVAEMLEAGEFVDQAGRPWQAEDRYRPNVFIWFHRHLAPEPPVPFDIEVLYADERLVVVDKPHFLATTPRGVHVRETVLVRLRESLGLPDLAPAHRLDRLTAGVLVLTAQREHRAAYASLFQAQQVQKTYEALAPYDPSLEFPRRVTNRIEKRRGSLQAVVTDGEPNADSLIELVETRAPNACYRLTPATGKTHQLRVHLAGLGLPILGDPLYPTVLDVDADDFSTPLQLVARSLAFIDPIDQTPREYVSHFALEWPEVRQ
ncbi:pseudouridine synthase [Propionicimonas sp.]|uniref:pseudouridine synthase n=1 Tax=Propionicimonas sp. TaxID=1955623 RepID=UPI00184EA11F|nr:pseudouridine synthase [Propionicimonas sp.]MBU3976418.1 pseudouridylate synthase [Actinomycetota bacterium]MBA3021990.1 pseudouridylate synthase [Propionicimonas sp.]MBU3987575.1 pseudouridylate synthase [Actinomycetota bacterium]MBU4006480.1 pseudouridylate synthase [Actinomycetota bacterium]MBU4065085.1 pseudouridylate synthase [Actinomycetota bacterium]